ncbi:hypothetical protein ACOSQ2_029892 [Xanthoceras sorbifolium]
MSMLNGRANVIERMSWSTYSQRPQILYKSVSWFSMFTNWKLETAETIRAQVNSTIEGQIKLSNPHLSPALTNDSIILLCQGRKKSVPVLLNFR